VTTPLQLIIIIIIIIIIIKYFRLLPWCRWDRQVVPKSENNYQHILRKSSKERRSHSFSENFQLENCKGRNDKRTLHITGLSGCISSHSLL
jgi:hypothetical protein